MHKNLWFWFTPFNNLVSRSNKGEIKNSKIKQEVLLLNMTVYENESWS